MEDVLRWIGRAEIIVADVTSRNPNVFYELGIAHMAKDVEKVLILTQTMDDVPFDLRPFRCIVYEQSQGGLRELQRVLTANIKEVSRGSYRFSIKQEGQYHFPHKLFGPDRCFHDFEITQMWVAPDSAKFYLKEYRHVLGKPIETVKQEGRGLRWGEEVPLEGVPWKLVLEETNMDTGRFRVVPTE